MNTQKSLNMKERRGKLRRLTISKRETTENRKGRFKKINCPSSKQLIVMKLQQQKGQCWNKRGIRKKC